MPQLVFRRSLLCFLLLALGLPLASLAQGDDAAGSDATVTRGAEEVQTLLTPFRYEGDLSNLPRAAQWQPGDPIKEIPRRRTRPALTGEDATRLAPPVPRRDPLLERQEQAALGSGDRSFRTLLSSFAGQGFTGVNPPDPVGDVGPGVYIQSINAPGGALVTIYDKASGAVQAGPFAMDSLGAGGCAFGNGDPIVLYDRQADRWLMAEFSGVVNAMCFYVSMTNDPIAGGWFNYQLNTPNFPDYPKIGIWENTYLMTTNEAVPRAYALDRASMLGGAAGTAIIYNLPALAAFPFQALTPADVDGPNGPPAGSPALAMRHRDDEVHGPFPANGANDTLEIFEFAPDFANPPASTVTGPFSIAVAEFDSNLCGLVAFSCFTQPAGPPLDPLREVVMWRLQYRNTGPHEALVGNLVTDVNGLDQGGVRWFELRRSGGPWGVFQEGTFAPDTDSRWMGSIASDIAGNMALGYNVASNTQHPELRVTGRLATDPAGVMSQPEAVLGVGSASNPSVRYGDYNSMNVDPDDDCTFWFTGEHNPAVAWSTSIGSFRFGTCPAPVCGNGIIEPGEQCDGVNLGGETCRTQGFTRGNLRCDNTCSFNTQGCFNCVTDVMGGPTSCKPISVWLDYANTACRNQGLFLTAWKPSTSCGPGVYREFKYECCDRRPKCKTEVLGGPTSCKDLNTWTRYAIDTCSSQGLSMLSFGTGTSCGPGLYEDVKFDCCKAP